MIDCNAHPTPDGKWFQTAHDASVSTLLRQMDEAGVEKCIAVPFAGHIPEHFPLDLASRHPDRIIAAASFNPAERGTPEETVKAFREKVKDWTGRVKIVKLHNRLHGYSPNDSRAMAFLEANNNLRHPFLVFICGLLVGKGYPTEVSPPSHFLKLATLFPRTTFVVMHAGSTWALQVFEAIKGCQNVFLDLSFVQTKFEGSSLEQDLKFICKHFDRRLLWGSDFPEIPIGTARESLMRLTEGLPQSKVQNIAKNNIGQLLAIPHGEY